jgi:hypothetical protein
VRVSAPGFQEKMMEVELKTSTSVELNIQLELETMVQRVEVQEREEALTTESTVSAAVLQGQELENLPVPEQTFRDALRVAPGVVRINDEKLNIRGSAETHGMLQVNSVEMTDPVTGAFSIRVPADAIRKLSTEETPFDARYGGFSGGLAAIETKPPSANWHWKISDFIPSIRGRSGHWVGLSEAVARLSFGSPLLPGKLNFSEAFQYEMKRTPVRGLAWPHNETKAQGFNSYTSFQVVLSPRHVVSAAVNVFPRRVQFANISALIPQTASSDYGQRGLSGSISDFYQFSSGAILETGLSYTRFDSRAFGQGPQDMVITPNGWAGNFFNTWARKSSALGAFSVFQFASENWHGHHDFRIGSNVNRRSFTGRSVSHPVRILRQDSTLAEEIAFQDEGLLGASSTDGGAFVQDHWSVNAHMAVDFGGRLSVQSVGRSAVFDPRLALAYSPSKDSKTIFRAGAGLFDGRASLLDASFADNPTRVVSYFDPSGNLMGARERFPNIYVAKGSGPPSSRIRRTPNSAPRTFVANFQIDRQLSEGAALRLAYTFSRTYDLFVVNPLSRSVGGSSFMTLSNSGVSRYHAFEATLRLQPLRQTDLNLSYIWSRNRGDLNTSSEIFVPFEQPVIGPDAFSIASSDVPHRFVVWGQVHLPWKMILSPVTDIHTGLPYSNVDVLQNYVGKPNGQRFPTFFTLDARIYRDFHLPLRGLDRSSKRKLRLGVYSIDLTNHKNYNDVFRNITSPFFGHFVGFEHRLNGAVLEIVE